MPSVSPAQHRWIGWLHSNPEARKASGMSQAKVDEWLHSDKGSPWKHHDAGGGIVPKRASGGEMPSDLDFYAMTGGWVPNSELAKMREQWKKSQQNPPPTPGSPIEDHADGGIVGHYDDGGATGDYSSIGGPTPSAQTMNPITQSLIQRYASLPTEKLTEYAAMLGGTPQAQLIQRILQQRHMMPNAAPLQPTQAAPQQQQQQQVMPQPGQPGGGVALRRGGAPKRTHAVVHYGTGMPSAHCSICEHFRAPHSCEIVESPIRPDGWCNQFRKRQALRDGGTVKRDLGGMMGLSTADPWWTRAEARGDSGLLHGTTSGQADAIKTQAPPGSFVVPAEVVAGLGEGNTLAGARVMQAILNSGPHGIPLPRGTRGRGPPRPPSVPADLRGGLKEGGEVPLFEAKARGGGKTESGKTPVDLSDGEFVISPEHVKAWGGGDTERGIRIWNKWTWAKHKEHIKDLKDYRGPVGMKKEDKT